MFDIIIKNGYIIDGSGQKPGFRADVGIRDARIEKIGNLGKERSEKEILAEGLYVTPGFVDINTDSDHNLTIFTQPGQRSLLRQGVTTIIGGNCGSSLAPLVKGSLISIRKWADPNQININWQSVEGFLKTLELKKLGLNFGTLIGHSTLRRGIIGEEFRDLTDRELEEMKFLIKQGIEQGAFGFSSGLAYSHSRIAPQREMEELVKIVKEKDALYATHLRSEGEGFIAAVTEACDIAKTTGVVTQITHFKATIPFEKDFSQGLKLIEEAAEAGALINFDIYPYETGAFHLYTLLPQWATVGGFENMVRNLSNGSIRERVIADMKRSKIDFGELVIAEAGGQDFLAGKTIKEVAQNREVSPEEAVCQILTLASSTARTIVFIKVTTQENINLGLRHRLSFVSSNGAGYDKGPEGIIVHPRSFGAFPKFLKFIREKEPLSWEKAIRKITFGPAKKLQVKNRGLLKEGYFADITIFDPSKIEDRATTQDPFRYPKGIEYVIVNGRVVIERGMDTGMMAGKVLRRGW